MERTIEPVIDSLSAEQGDIVVRFVERVPRGEYLFFKEDIGKPGVIDEWFRNGADVLVARLDGDLAGLLAVIPGLGWSRHVAEFRMVVDPAMRGRGIGSALARRGLVAAVAAGLTKVSVEVLADQESVVGVFGDLGFLPEALLADHARDDEGEFHDLLVLSHQIEETHSALTTLGVADGELHA